MHRHETSRVSRLVVSCTRAQSQSKSARLWRETKPTERESLTLLAPGLSCLSKVAVVAVVVVVDPVVIRQRNGGPDATDKLWYRQTVK